MYRLHILYISGCLLFSQAAYATTSLLQAVKNGSVSMDAVKNEHVYYEKGLDLHIKNNTNKPLELSIDPAMVFVPDDTSEQNLVIIHNETLALKAGEEQTISIQSFCAKSYASVPHINMRFNYWKRGDTNMVQLLQYIVTHKISGSTAQSAVWVLTNDHSLGDIYVGNDTAAQNMVKYLAALLRKPLPNIYGFHNTNNVPGMPAYNPKPLKMLAKFEYIAEQDQTLTLGVFKEDGSTIEAVFENKPFGAGGHRFTVEFDAADVPKGNYYIRLLTEGRVLKEEKVKIE